MQAFITVRAPQQAGPRCLALWVTGRVGGPGGRDGWEGMAGRQGVSLEAPGRRMLYIPEIRGSIAVVAAFGLSFF